MSPQGVGVGWGAQSTMVSILASGPSCPGFGSQRSQIFSEKNVGQRRSLEEKSGQWFGNFDQIHSTS